MNSRICRVSGESIARTEPSLPGYWSLPRFAACNAAIYVQRLTRDPIQKKKNFASPFRLSRRFSPSQTLRIQSSIILYHVSSPITYMHITFYVALYKVTSSSFTKQRVRRIEHPTFQKQRNSKKLARFREDGSRNGSIVDLKFTSIDILQTTRSLVFEFEEEPNVRVESIPAAEKLEFKRHSISTRHKFKTQ